MIAIARAPGSSAGMSPRTGSTGSGRPVGTGEISASPCSSTSVSATSKMPPATATSGPGTCGATRRSTSSTPIENAETATVGALLSPRCRTADASSLKNPDASGSEGMPSSCGSCPTATVSPTPVLIPVIVAGLTFSTSAPSRNRRMTSRHSPTRNASVNASRSNVSGSRDGSVARMVATSTAIVDVVDTLRRP